MCFKSEVAVNSKHLRTVYEKLVVQFHVSAYIYIPSFSSEDFIGFEVLLPPQIPWQYTCVCLIYSPCEKGRHVDLDLPKCHCCHSIDHVDV